MQDVHLPETNWWVHPDAHHAPIEQQEMKFRPDSIPPALNSENPFQSIHRPTPVYISRQLSELMREIVPAERAELFCTNTTTEVRNIDLNQEMIPGSFQPLQTDQLSVMTDESFTNQPVQTGEENAEELIGEVDAHLKYLRDRLNRLNMYDAKAPKSPKAKPKPNRLQKKPSLFQTVDPISRQNEEIVTMLMAKNPPSLYELQTVRKQNVKFEEVQRQTGGPSTAFIKRNSGPFRKQAKLIPPSPLTQEVDRALVIKSSRPADRKMVEVEVRELKLDHSMNDVLKRKQKEIDEYKKATMFQTDTVQFKSVEDSKKDIIELKLNNDHDDNLLATTQKILEQLKTDEKHITEMLGDYGREITRAPTDQWYVDRSSNFAREAKQNRLQEMVREIGLEFEEVMMDELAGGKKKGKDSGSQVGV